ncbi:MAG: putative Ig domain-containing protein [Kiritimatiellae bacterium]|nr:putative Ig domain-containing protein [Kiritimatiellia bacterium]
MKVRLTKWLSALWVMVMSAVAAAGNMVTANAKAEKGQVFAGWYIDAERTVPYASGGADYRTAQMSYAPDETDALFARFATEAEDKESIDFDLSLNPFYNSNAALSIPLSGAVKSLSLPTLTVANLPTGVRYDAKTLSLTGTPTKPGETKVVKFTIKNLSNKAGEVFTKTFKIGDAQAASLPDLHYNDANGYPAFTPGAAVDMANVLGTATMATLAEGGWAVTGLPAGMTFNSKDGTFKGAPTAANTSYLVTFKKGTGANAETATITLKTGALPELEIGANIVDEAGLPVTDEAVLKQIRLTGKGAYAANKAVTLSATAPKGYVFAGWYQGGTVPVENGKQDFRTASGFGWTMPSVDTTLTAKFIPVAADHASVADVNEGVPVATVSLKQGQSMPETFIKDAVDSGSFPTVTVKGLPAGIKFDAKTLLLSGAATDKTAKWYDLVVKVKNASGYTYTGIFGVSVNGGEPAADVDELGLGSTLDWLDNLKVGGIVEDESSFGTSGDGVTGVTISPAMPEIKIYKESDDGETIFLVDEINGEMPVVKTPGVYTATVNGRVNGKAAKTTKRFIVRDSVSLYERVLVAPGCEGMGTVTGDGKVVHPGEAFAINATPKAGCLFAGWYADPECNSRAWFMPEVADYRQASQSGTVSTDESPGEDVFAYGPTKLNPTVRYARFIQKAADADIRIEVGFAPRLLGDGVYDFADFRDGAEFQVKIFSGTLPTVTFQNLPTWIDKDPVRYFDGLWLSYNGKSEPDPGEYSFTMTARTVGGATATRKFTIKVDNYRNQSLALDYENGYTLFQGASFDMAKAMPGIDLTGWTVTGLPAGMTFRNGVISGAPTKPDTSYTVWFKKAGEDSATVTMRTKSLPSWVVGTFYGICYVDDWPNGIEIKVAASGAVTATIVDVDAPFRVKATNVYRDGENFCFDFSQSQANGDHSSGHVIISKSLIDEADQTPLGYLSGTEEGEDEDGDPYNCEWIAYQDAYVAKPAGVVLPTFAASDSTLQIPVNEPLDGTLTLKFGANGVVTPAWSGDGKFAMFAAHMTPVLVTDDVVHAYVWVMGYNRADDEAIGFNVELWIPVSNGAANASDVDADIEYFVFGY